VGVFIVLRLHTLIDDVVEATDDNEGVTEVAILVVTNEKLLLLLQLFSAVTVTLYIVLGVNPLTVNDVSNVLASPSTLSLHLTMYLIASSTSSHCTTNDVLVMLLNLMFAGVPGCPGRSVV